MLNHHKQRLLATVATAAALAATAPAALAMPIDGTDSVGAIPEREQIRVVRVQVDQGLDWSDAGIGAAGMLAVVLIGYGGAHALTGVSRRERSVAQTGR
jgi:hypothetical protein